MSLSAPLPNFDQAEFHGAPPPPDRCAYCHRDLTTEYFRIDGNLACAPCAQHAQSLIPPDSHKAYSRAVVFGIAAAIAGCIGYALVTILTGWTVGYAAIGVGYIVGKAMKAGSRGLGGRRYQITAALLTYAAVTVAFVPIALHERSETKHSTQSAAVSTSQAPAPDATSPPTAPAAGPHLMTSPTTPPAQKFAPGRFLLGLTALLVIGLISPFLELAASPGGGLLGLFIIFIGVSTAWRLTQRIASEVDGPFEQAPSRL